MPGQHPNAVKEDRSRRAIQVAQEMSESYRAAMVGTVAQVLFEEPEEDFFTGHTPNYVKVYVRGEGLHNRLCPVKITGLYRDGVEGRLL